jgi:general secretion pathway protein H
VSAARPRGRRRGFTLIELLAVVLIFALLAGIALPNLGLRSSRLLDEEARRLAGSLEFARQRAVMTGLPHRVFVDIDRGAYQVEWYGPLEAEAEADAAASPAEVAKVELAAPLAAEVDFQPLVGTLGDIFELDPAVHFAGIETPEGMVEAGQVQIVFQRDGTSDPAAVALGIESGRRAILHVLPLADSVRLERVDP